MSRPRKAKRSICGKGFADIVKLLLDAGANKYVKAKDGMMPLLYAQFFGDLSYTEVKNLLK